MMRYSRAAFVALILLVHSGLTEGAVIRGDIAIIGFASDIPDGISFVALSDIANGEAISFWDSGFIGPGTGEGAGGGNWRGTESSITWTNDTGSAVSAGTVVVISDSAADLGNVSGGTFTGLSTEGDQVFVGQGTAPSGNPSTFDGTLLFAVDFEGADGWDATTADTNDSALPSALASNNITFSEIDNGQYTGTRTVNSSAQLASLIADTNNWTTSNSAIVLNSTDFTISGVPEPSGFAVLALGMMGFSVARRRRVG